MGIQQILTIRVKACGFFDSRLLNFSKLIFKICAFSYACLDFTRFVFWYRLLTSNALRASCQFFHRVSLNNFFGRALMMDVVLALSAKHPSGLFYNWLVSSWGWMLWRDYWRNESSLLEIYWRNLLLVHLLNLIIWAGIPPGQWFRFYIGYPYAWTNFKSAARERLSIWIIGLILEAKS